MATSTASITSGIDFENDDSISRTDLNTAFTNAIVGDFTRAHMHNSASVVTLGTVPSASLVTGEMWLDSTDTLPVLRRYNGSAWVPVAYEPKAYAEGASASPFGYAATTGMMYYATDLHTPMFYDTVIGSAKFSPASGGVMIVHNEEGTAILKGQAVILGITGNFTYPSVQLPSTTLDSVPKNPNVWAVALEDIGAFGDGMVALITSGRSVNIRVDPSTHAVAVGDGIATLGGTSTATLGDCRSVGQLYPRRTPVSAVDAYQFGLPYGCFAVALAASSGTSVQTVACKLLGQVGRGRWQRFEPFIIGTEANVWAGYSTSSTSGWYEIDLTNTPHDATNVLTQEGESKHEPILAASVLGWVTGSGVSGANRRRMTMEYGLDKSTTLVRSTTMNMFTSTSGSAAQHPPLVVPTCAGFATPKVPGELFSTISNHSSHSGAENVTSAVGELRVDGYLY